MPEEVTYFTKEEIECPICLSSFRREELLTGRGRLNAGELTDELRRYFIPTQKYGKVNPLLYPITVCPNCFYATDDYDFLSVSDKVKQNLKDLREIRAKYLMKIFGFIPNYNEKRNLYSGCGSYILAISCYPFFDKKKYSPTIKRGIYSLRTAWLFNDLFDETKEQKYKELAWIFYKKASEFYSEAIENQTKGIEPIENVKNFGPDVDKNYGYDGVLYVAAVLKYKTSNTIEDPEKKLKAYEEVKRILSKVFGVGKKAKDKPEVLLNFAKDIYEKIGQESEKFDNMLKGLKEDNIESDFSLEGLDLK